MNSVNIVNELTDLNAENIAPIWFLVPPLSPRLFLLFTLFREERESTNDWRLL